MKSTHLYALSIAGFLLSATVTLAQDATAPATSPAATASTAPADDPNEIICRRGEPVVGTRLPGPRICHTRKEWKDIQYQTQQNIQQMQQKAGSANPNGG